MRKLGQAGGGIVPTLSRCIVQAMSDAYHPGHIGSKIDLNVSPCLGIDLICLLLYTYREYFGSTCGLYVCFTGGSGGSDGG